MQAKIVKHLLCLFVFTATLNSNAQHKVIVIDSTVDGRIKFANIIPDTSRLAWQNGRIDSKVFLREVLKAGKNTEFYLYRVVTDELGMQHEKYQQTFNGVNVEFGEYIVHRDRQGDIVSINGNFESIADDYSVEPGLRFEEAFEKLKQKNKTVRYAIMDLPVKQSVDRVVERREENHELVIIRGYDNQVHLAYKVNLYENSILDNYWGYIDCATGDIVFKAPRTTYTNSPTTVQTLYSGQRQITTDSYQGGYRLRENSRGGTGTPVRTLNFNEAPLSDTAETRLGMRNALDYTDNDNSWTRLEHGDSVEIAAFDAHWGAEMAFDYFLTQHTRNSYDDKGDTIRNYVHVYAKISTLNHDSEIVKNVKFRNSCWSDYFHSIFYGDSIKPMVGLDMVAHEFGHGVCFSSVGPDVGLIYFGESGALNESLSDIWGACVESWASTGKQTWLFAEDVFAGGVRSMSNPKLKGQPNTYKGDYWYNTDDCDQNSYDNCGVHRNSGVGNYWFYLLVNGGAGTNDIGNSYSVTGIGISDAAIIVYRMENFKLLPSYGYNDVRNASIYAATDLFGANSCQVINVTNAWHAVGVGEKFQFTNVTLTGPSLICSTGTTFTVNNLPASCTVTWSSSSNLYRVSSAGNTAVFKATGSGAGWVQATLLYCNGYSTPLPASTVTVGSPRTDPISINFNVPPKRFTASIESVPTATSYKWYLDGVLKYNDLRTDAIFQRQLQNCGHIYNVDVYTVNACGTSAVRHAEVSEDPCYKGFTISPNPASDNITITIDTPENTLLQSSVETDALMDSSRFISTSSYTISIIDSFGAVKSILRKTGTSNLVPINILSNGIYIVEINDGSKVFRQQLVVKR